MANMDGERKAPDSVDQLSWRKKISSVLQQARHAEELGKSKALRVSPPNVEGKDTAKSTTKGEGGAAGSKSTSKSRPNVKLSERDSTSIRGLTEMIKSARTKTATTSKKQTAPTSKAVVKEVDPFRIIMRLQQRLKVAEQQNDTLTHACTSLQSQLDTKMTTHRLAEDKLKTENEEVKMKLKTLEAHFQALNESLEQQREVRIVRLDAELEKEKKESAGRQEKLSYVIEDLEDKLQCREVTIANLEETISKMRLDRFKKKKKKSKSKEEKSKKERKSRRTKSAGSSLVSSAASAYLNDDDDDDDAASVVSTNSTASSMVMQSYQETAELAIAAAVDRAVSETAREKTLEHKEQMEQLRESYLHKIEEKEIIIENLEKKIDDMIKKNNQVRLRDSKQGKRHAHMELNMRNVSVVNELMNESMYRLQNMMERLKKEEEAKPKLEEEQGELHETMEDTIQIKDMKLKKAAMRNLGDRLQLMNEELKISMRLLEQRMNNGIESAKQKNGVVTAGEVPGQASGEDEDDAKTAQKNLLDLIQQVHTDTTTSIRDTETNLMKELTGLRDQIRVLEVEIDSKQDMIESLELACAENSQHLRSLNEQLNKDKNEEMEEYGMELLKSITCAEDFEEKPYV